MVRINGIYRHHKTGDNYQVIKTGKHTETNEILVVYVRCGEEEDWYIRPLSMFTEIIQYEGVWQPRFKFIGDTRNKLWNGS